jgi:multimeric flavodoxin WrbA
MNQSILIITSSLRRNSNSSLLANSLASGASEAGNKVEIISLIDKQINFCHGCLACQKTHRCVIKDDMLSINEKIKKADILVFATPIYYYEMSGLLKTVLDRANPLYGTDYSFRKVYLLTSAADEEITTPSRAIEGIKGWVSCFPKAHFVSYLFAGGVTAEGEIKDKPILQEAYKLGKSL